MAKTTKAKAKPAKAPIEDGELEQPPMKRITPMRQKFLDKIESIRDRKRQRNEQK